MRPYDLSQGLLESARLIPKEDNELLRKIRAVPSRVVLRLFLDREEKREGVFGLAGTLPAELKDKVDFCGINVFCSQKMTAAFMMEFGVLSMQLPLYLFFKDGKLIANMPGTLDNGLLFENIQKTFGL